ncbi:MAG: hypothetical protein LF885_07270 (plasmid) [Rickettsia endosymbiont of Culicoides impunctatus]|nr:MAG: hypothetical protein LF885_07270 [Rickettsia endosymbiont of Culicoides impunctatus]
MKASQCHFESEPLHVVKYLEHWKDHVDHRILPIHDINRIIERELERQIAHDHHHHSLDL